MVGLGHDVVERTMGDAAVISLMARRSLLFTPGNRPSMLRKAPNSGADVLVFDLEDAVGPAQKDQARQTIRTVLADQTFDPEAEVCVRLNPIDTGAAADLEVVLTGSMPDSVMLPKVESADEVENLTRLLDEGDADCPVLVLIESARGVLHAETIADVPLVDGLFFGAEDLAADMGATRTAEGTEVLHAREHVVLAAAAANVDAIDTIYPDITDTNGLREEARFARTLGFDGKAAIHPDQVSIINDAFTPDKDELARARRIVAASDEANDGVFRLDDEMIDTPIVRQAERVIRRADAADDHGDDC